MSAKVEQIWRYPVKSLQGESIARTAVERRGLVGDRLWAVRDQATGKLGSGKDTRRFRRFPGPPLLELAARYPADPSPSGPIQPPIVVDATGGEHRVVGGEADLLLRRQTGIPTLLVARESDVDHFDEGPVSIIGTSTMHWVQTQLPDIPVDPRRFRPNLVVSTSEEFEEESWCGQTVRIGVEPDAVRLAIDHVLERCVMVNTAQADLPYAPMVLKLLGRRQEQRARLAVLGAVVNPGTLEVGDVVTID